MKRKIEEITESRDINVDTWSGLTAGGKVSGRTAEKRSNQIYSNAFYNSSGTNMHDIARQKSHQNNKDDDKALYQEILILYLVLPPTLPLPSLCSKSANYASYCVAAQENLHSEMGKFRRVDEGKIIHQLYEQT